LLVDQEETNMDTGNIDQPAICKECGVTTTLDSVQQICWECWILISDEMESHETQEDLNEEE
jgi:hypothetical protein